VLAHQVRMKNNQTPETRYRAHLAEMGTLKKKIDATAEKQKLATFTTFHVVKTSAGANRICCQT